MNTKQILDLYTDYLITSTSQTTATGLSEILDNDLSHDQITRFLNKNTFTSKDLWEEVKPMVRSIGKEDGVLSIDDTILEKPYMDESELICYHFNHCSGTNVKGINLLNCTYTVGNASIPVAYEAVTKPIEYIDEKTQKRKRKSIRTKNEMFRDMVKACVYNKIPFTYVLSDIWFASNENMEYIKKDLKKNFIMAMKSNRLVTTSLANKKQGIFVHMSELDFEKNPLVIFIQGLSFPVLVMKKVFTNKDGSTGILYLVSSDLNLNDSDMWDIYHKRWNIEVYHKSIKSNTCIEKSPARKTTAQLNHIFASLCAYFKLECLKICSDTNHFAIKRKLYMSALKKSFGELQQLKLHNPMFQTFCCVT